MANHPWILYPTDTIPPINQLQQTSTTFMEMQSSTLMFLGSLIDNCLPMKEFHNPFPILKIIYIFNTVVLSHRVLAWFSCFLSWNLEVHFLIDMSSVSWYSIINWMCLIFLGLLCWNFVGVVSLIALCKFLL